MQNKVFKKNLLVQNVLDTSVNFQADGDILVVPCPWEDDKQVTNGERVRYRGGIEVDADGRTRVKRYNEGTGPIHELLYETPHGAVKMTRPQYSPSDNGYRRFSKEFVYVTFKFPKKYGAALARECFEKEADEILSYLKTRKEETIWK